MNSEHLRTFIWLRWRLLMHQLGRAGLANTILLAILGVLLAVGIVFFAGLSFLMGLFIAHDEAASGKLPAIIMFCWDGAVFFFLMSWGSGLIAELQRSEALSLQKFLHLPVSLSGVFVLNYVSSLFCLTMAIFFPIALCFSIAVCFSIGPTMLAVLPLLASFLLMVTGISYQFQGWLAALMINKRRRRSVVVLATFLFVLLCQVPNLINILRPWPAANQVEHGVKALTEPDDARFHEIANLVWIANLVLPPGWLPLGAMAAAEGNVWPALLGTIGMGLIGTASLWRAYRTTIQLSTGHFSGVLPVVQTPRAGNEPQGSSRVLPRTAAENMLEKRLPGLSEPTAVIALAGLRSLLRAPEVRMVLLTPVLMVVIFGALMFRTTFKVPVPFRPLIGFGLIVMSLFSLIGIVGNQFAFDRNGFRALVLSPACRRDMLLGKNLAVLPLAVALCVLPLVLAQIVMPTGLEQMLAEPIRFVTMYLLFCLLANWLSLLTPMPIAAGTLKPTNVKLVPVLVQLVCILALPIMLSPALLPLWLDYRLQGQPWSEWIPINLLSSLILCAVVMAIYWLVLIWQGWVLQSRELHILQTITTKTE